MATFTWLGGSGDYSSANWAISGPASGTAPGTADIAILGGTAAYTVTVLPTTLSPTTVPLGHNATLNDPNAILSVQVAFADAPGTLTIAAGTVELTGTAGHKGIVASAIVNDGTIISAGLGIYSDQLLANVTNNGLIVVDGDSMDLGYLNVVNAGTIALSNFATVTLGANVTNTGLISLAGGAVLDMSLATPQNTAVAGTIDFLDGSGSSLITGAFQGTTYMSSVVGFQPGDTIDLIHEVQYAATESVTLAGGDLVVSDQGTTLAAIPVANIVAGKLSLTQDNLGWAQITMTACFATGTRIATTRGEVAVERLRVGDNVLGPDGSAQPAIWLGHRRVDCHRHPRPHDVWPVCVQAGAFAPGVPSRDLFLSPDHAVFADGVLIPVRYLINGRTIAQVKRASVTYWHVELPQHGVLLAEGLPAESYLDTGNRAAFVGGGPALHLHPDFARQVWDARGCAPLLLDGPLVQVVRARLFDRAEALGHARTFDAALQVSVGGEVLTREGWGSLHRFRLPPGTRSVTLRSRSAVPAHTRADAADHRRLGVAVRFVVLDGQTIALSDARLGEGWHEVECERGVPAWRWTDGAARLDVRSAGWLELVIARTELYWQDEASPRAAAAGLR